MKISNPAKLLIILQLAFVMACGSSVKGDLPPDSNLPNPDFSTRSDVNAHANTTSHATENRA